MNIRNVCTNKSALNNKNSTAKVVWYHSSFKSKLKYSKRQTVRKNNVVKNILEMIGSTVKNKIKNKKNPPVKHAHPATVHKCQTSKTKIQPRDQKQQDFKALLYTNARLCSRILCMTGKQAAQSNSISKLLKFKKNNLSLLTVFKALDTWQNLKMFLGLYKDCAWHKILISVQAQGQGIQVMSRV